MELLCSNFYLCRGVVCRSRKTSSTSMPRRWSTIARRLWTIFYKFIGFYDLSSECEGIRNITIRERTWLCSSELFVYRKKHIAQDRSHVRRLKREQCKHTKYSNFLWFLVIIFFFWEKFLVIMYMSISLEYYPYCVYMKYWNTMHIIHSFCVSKNIWTLLE
jgi:hypothetical protein